MTPAYGLLQIGLKLEKWQWRPNFWNYVIIVFWGCFLFLVKFSYWFKFHGIIIIGSWVITIFFYKKLTRNPEIRNTPISVLPNIYKLGQIKDIKFGTNVFREMNAMLGASAKILEHEGSILPSSFYWHLPDY